MPTIEELRKKQLAKEQELMLLREEIKKKKRNDDYRQKMLLGGIILTSMQSDKELQKTVLDALKFAVISSKADRDRQLLQRIVDNIGFHDI